MPIPPLTDEVIADRFSYHSPSPAGVAKHAALTRSHASAAHVINSTCPEGREKALAMTKLEESKFWASAAVARNPETC